ncbi:MAG: IclR family transcriptional regulator [Pseudomonadota bacterium]
MTDPAPKLDSTLSKGLLILETLATAKGGRGVTDLSRELGLTKSNTFRLLRTLAHLGYVEHQDDRTYAATLKTWRVGRALIETDNLRELAAPEMSYLSEETGETVYLAVREGLSVVYIDKRDSSKPIRSWNAIGGTAPLHCVGTGKALLAAEFEALQGEIAAHLTGFTDRTLTTMAAVRTDVAQTLRQGYAFDRGEFRERILSFGAVIALPDCAPVAALGLSLPDVNMPANGEDRMGGLVLHAARAVSQKLARR